MPRSAAAMSASRDALCVASYQSVGEGASICSLAACSAAQGSSIVAAGTASGELHVFRVVYGATRASEAGAWLELSSRGAVSRKPVEVRAPHTPVREKCILLAWPVLLALLLRASVVGGMHLQLLCTIKTIGTRVFARQRRKRTTQTKYRK